MVVEKEAWRERRRVIVGGGGEFAERKLGRGRDVDTGSD